MENNQTPPDSSPKSNKIEAVEILSINYPIKSDLIEAVGAGVNFRYVYNDDEVKDILNIEKEEEVANNLCAVIYCPKDLKRDPSEIGQMLSYKYSGRSLLYVTQEKQFLTNRELIKKNGFEDLYLDPFESELIKQKLIGIVDSFRGNQDRVFSPVKLVDLNIGDVLTFDIFILLSANKKYVRYLSAGVPIDQAKLEKLKKHEMNLLFIPKTSMPKFYKHTANQISGVKNNSTMSETEKQQKVEDSLRKLTGRLFDSSLNADSAIQDGKAIYDELKGLTQNLILNSDGGAWYKKMQMVIGGGGDPYSHSSRVSSLASLFSLATGKGKPEVVAIAGLVHDLGESLLSKDILSKSPDKLTPEEFSRYSLHPEWSLKILKEKRMAVDELLGNCILLHHKRWNGAGFPKTVVLGDRIPIEAQLLAIADEFDYLTNVNIGAVKIKASEAFDIMEKKMEHNPALLKHIKRVFLAGA